MDKCNPKRSKKPGFPEAVIAAAQWIGPSAAYDNMVQQRNIYGCGGLTKLSGKLDVCRTWGWISTGMIVSADDRR